MVDDISLPIKKDKKKTSFYPNMAHTKTKELSLTKIKTK
jgi:hypothetical protein